MKNFQVSNENGQNSNENLNFLPCPEGLELDGCTI